MASNIILPRLTQWAEGRISGLAHATSQSSFDETFNDTFLQNVSVTLNGEHLSREDYKQQLWSLNFEELDANVTFTESAEDPDKDLGEKAGSVNLVYDVVVTEAIVVFGEPQQRKYSATFKATIEQDPSIKPPTIPVRGFFDPRRVSKVDQVITPQKN